MKKKLLATAIGAALAASPMLAAQADVKLFGRVQVELAQETVEADTDGDGVNETDTSGYSFKDNALGRIGIAASEDLGGGIFRVRASVQNQGYLPTALERAKALGLAKPVTVVLEGGEVLSEPTTHSLGTLTGWGPARSNRPSYNAPGAPVHDVSWVVRGKAGDPLTVEVRSERGGRHQVQMRLGR